MENNELQHWGIKGQRWGHRRFQNKDGSLTPAGRKRYDDDDGDAPYKKQYEAARKELAAEKAKQKSAQLEYKTAKQEARKAEAIAKKEAAIETARQKNEDTISKYAAKQAKLDYKAAKFEQSQAAKERRLELNTAKQEAKMQEKAEKRKEFTKRLAIGAGIAAAAGLTYYGLKKYQERQAMGQDLSKKMLDNMKGFTVDDISSQAARGRQSFGDAFKSTASKVKTKLEDNIDAGSMKDDSDRPSASSKSKTKSSKPDYDIEIQDAPKQSAPKTEKKRPSDIFDVDFEDVTPAKKAKGESIFSRMKKKLEDNIEMGPIKDDGDAPSKRAKSDYDIEIQDAPKSSTYNPNQVPNKSKPRDVYDVDYDDVSSRGKSAISGYLNSPISGLLSSPKTNSTPPDTGGGTKSKWSKRIDKQASKLTDDQIKKNTSKIEKKLNEERQRLNARLEMDLASKRATTKEHYDRADMLRRQAAATDNEYTKSRLQNEIDRELQFAQTWQRLAKEVEERLKR